MSKATIKAPESPSKSADSFEERLVRYSEQLGRIAGTVHAKTEGWMDRAALLEHLTRIRDGATDLLSHLTRADSAGDGDAGANRAPSEAARQSREREKARSASLVAAPGKRHRSHEPAHGIKHSDERISKLKAASKKGRRGGRG